MTSCSTPTSRGHSSMATGSSSATSSYASTLIRTRRTHPAGVGMTSEHSPVTHAALDAEYEIIRELGRGGTALVYLARERATGDEVAIKIIRSRYIDDEEAQARFAREAR